MSSGPKSQSSSVSPQSSDGSNEPIGSIISPPNTSRGGKNEENPGSGIQLRTSARVSKKLKLEAEAAAQPPPEPKGIDRDKNNFLNLILIICIQVA